MNENTVFIYENALGKVRFEYNSSYWITDLPAISSVDIDVSSTRGRQQIGSTIIDQSVRAKEFTVDGVIFEPLSENRKHLLYVLAPRVPSTLTAIENGETWYLDVILQRTPDISGGNGVQSFQVSLYAEYPYWRTNGTYIRQVAGLTALFKFPFYTGGLWYISEFSNNYYASLENSGNVPAGVKITFSARRAIKNPQLLHMETGKKIAIEKSMAAGEKVIVSTVYGEKGVVSVDANGNRANGWKYLSIDSDMSFELMPGSNLLRGDTDNNRSGMSIRIEAPLGVKSGV